MSAWKSVQSRRFTVEENWFISGEVDGVKAISTSANTTLTAEQQQMLCASLAAAGTHPLSKERKLKQLLSLWPEGNPTFSVFNPARQNWGVNALPCPRSATLRVPMAGEDSVTPHSPTLGGLHLTLSKPCRALQSSGGRNFPHLQSEPPWDSPRAFPLPFVKISLFKPNCGV